MNFDGSDLHWCGGNRSTLARRNIAARSDPKENPASSGLPPPAGGSWHYLTVRPRSRIPLVPLAISAAMHAVVFLGFNGHPAKPARAGEPVVMMEIHLKPPPLEEDSETPDPAAGEPAEELAGVDAPRLPEIFTAIPLDATLTQALDPASFLPRADLTSTKLMSVPARFRPGGARGTAETLKDIFNVGDLDRQPQAIHQPVPHVPGTANRVGPPIEKVVVEFVINTKGEVVSPSIVSSEAMELNEIALRGVVKWKFRPGARGGKKVNTRMIQPMVFRFDGE